jgi:DNA repair exonuclease SbcCD ATPase subunit
MKIKLQQLHLENFKGIKDLTIDFSSKTIIKGQNATGKTTIFDAVMWLLFDKNSTGDTKFQVRPLDAIGKRIDNVEILVRGIFDIDGKEIPIEKLQKQKWVEKRGTEVSELQGNENYFKYNLEPKSEKEYKDCISGLIDEDVFRMITNPQEFVSKKWKDQREMLMKLVSDVSDAEVIASNEKFASLAVDIESHDVNGLNAICLDALKRLKKEQGEIPARIDEVSRQKVDIDVVEKETKRTSLKTEIADIEKQIEEQTSRSEQFSKLSDEQMKYQKEANAILQQEIEKLRNKRNEIQKMLDDAESEFQKAQRDMSSRMDAISDYEKMIGNYTDRRNSLYLKYDEVSAKLFDETNTVCETCGQPLPAETMEERRKLFEDSKSRDLDSIRSSGKEYNAKLAEYEKLKADAQKEIESLKSLKIKKNGIITKCMDQLNLVQDSPDMSTNQEYNFLIAKSQDVDLQMRSMDNSLTYVQQLKIKRNGLNEELSIVEKEIAKVEANKAVEERIKELQVKQKELGQQVANMKKKQFLIEEVIREKCDLLASHVNEKFAFVDFKLFDMQLNGGMKETCECMVKGVPFSELNNGHKIVAGLDIINTLSELYGSVAPIFIDNAESINDFNIPDMSAQMILLTVSEDKKMVVV